MTHFFISGGFPLTCHPEIVNKKREIQWHSVFITGVSKRVISAYSFTPASLFLMYGASIKLWIITKTIMQPSVPKSLKLTHAEVEK